MSKYTIIFGSPRKNGNTASLLKPFMSELREMKVDIDYFDVYDMNIGGCRDCLWCQQDKKHIACVIKDDMQPILESISTSDTIVFASPIYAWSAPAPVKAVIDRTVYASCKYYGGDPYGPALLSGKRLALVVTCGYPVETGADLYAEEMKRYCKHCGMEFAGYIVERQKNLEDPFIDEQKIDKAGEFARRLQGIQI